MELFDSAKSILGFIVLIALLVFGAQMIWTVFVAITGRRSQGIEEEYVERRCSECNYDLRASGVKCPECGAINVDRRKYLKALSSDWPDNEIALREVEPGEKLDLLLSTADFQEAEFLREQLIARGIPCRIDETQIGNEYIPGQQRSTFTRVQVYTRDLRSARRYLAHVQGNTEYIDEMEPQRLAT